MNATRLLPKLLAFCIVSIFLLFSAAPATAQDITGKWYGAADVGGLKLRIIFDIEKDNDTYSAIMQSPDQSNRPIPVETVVFADAVLTITIPKIGFSYTGTLIKEGEIQGWFTQSGTTFVLNLSNEEPVINRPQEPKPPFPYQSEDVSFYNPEANINLAGTFTFLPVDVPTTAVVLVSGSGAQNRDEEMLGHKPFAVLADYLTRQGIAVLRYDDRGVGGSEGNFASATTPDFASDALAAVEYLKTRPEVDPARIGVIGHSEGGSVALMLAADQAVSFIVTLAGPGIDGSSILSMQQEALARKSGTPEAMITQSVETMKKAQELVKNIDDKAELEKEIRAVIANTMLAFQGDEIVKQLTMPGITAIIRFDPALYYPLIQCPVFALNGGKDLQVLADANLEAIERGLKEAGNNQVKIKKYPELNHLFQTAETGLPNEYGQIEETFNEEPLEDIAGWIKQSVSSYQ